MSNFGGPEKIAKKSTQSFRYALAPKYCLGGTMIEDDQAFVGHVDLHDRVDVRGVDCRGKPVLERPDLCLIIRGGCRARQGEASHSDHPGSRDCDCCS